MEGTSWSFQARNHHGQKEPVLTSCIHGRQVNVLVSGDSGVIPDFAGRDGKSMIREDVTRRRTAAETVGADATASTSPRPPANDDEASE